VPYFLKNCPVKFSHCSGRTDIAESFLGRGSVNLVAGAGCTSADVGNGAELELVDKFFYLGDMLSIDGNADAAE